MNKTKLAVAVLGLALAGVASAVTTTYNGTPFAILDVTTVQGTLTVPAADWSARRTTTCDVDTAVRLRHTWDSDLTLALKGPTGTIVKLWGGLGGSSDNFNVRIDDEAASNMSGLVNDGSSRRPQGHPGEAMCWFDGPNPAGVWTMIVTDSVGGDVGTMDAWSVVITAGPDGCESCLPRQPKGGGRGLGSSANNGGGNGDENNPPPGQHGR
jgi:subtilisin-like proprotein convertase family protein